MKKMNAILLSLSMVFGAGSALAAEAPKPLSAAELAQLKTADKGKIDNVRAGEMDETTMRIVSVSAALVGAYLGWQAVAR